MHTHTHKLKTSEVRFYEYIMVNNFKDGLDVDKLLPEFEFSQSKWVGISFQEKTLEDYVLFIL